MKVAINGFGRIGRAALKIALSQGVEVVAINDLGSVQNLAYLLQYDSIYGNYHDVSVKDGKLQVGAKSIEVFSEKDPAALPWKNLGVDVVLECTGVFTTTEGARGHITAGASHVIISAPAKDDVTPVFMQGVNAHEFSAGEVKVTSNASCTTNCLGPVVEIMHRRFGVKKAMASTIHSYTATQALVDSPQEKDFRRGRAAAMNIVPSTTGAAEATTKALPALQGKFDGVAFRVPTPAVSIADMVFMLEKKTTPEEVNAVLEEEAASERYKDVMGITHDPVVSSDFLGSSFTSIVDAALTKVVDGDMVKVVSWYDNEWGYATKLVEQAVDFAKKIGRS